MSEENVVRTIIRITVVGLLASVAVYVLRIRRLIDRWGASDEEVRRSMPGDDLVSQPHLQTTRAITIQAPIADVYPWLAQIGQGRGGFYSYDWLENNPIQQLGIHSADRILPDLQHLGPGDQIPVAPGPPFYGFLVAEVAAPERLVLEMRMHPFSGAQQDAAAEGASLHATWAFALEPTESLSTRLVTRTRSDVRLPVFVRVAYCLVLEAAMFVMERGMMLGIRARAERPRLAFGPEPRAVEQSLPAALPELEPAAVSHTRSAGA
jgi:hypothetical protein